jgi:hypothetical protein
MPPPRCHSALYRSKEDVITNKNKTENTNSRKAILPNDLEKVERRRIELKQYVEDRAEETRVAAAAIKKLPPVAREEILLRQYERHREDAKPKVQLAPTRAEIHQGLETYPEI